MTEQVLAPPARAIDALEILRFNELATILWQGGNYGYIWSTPSKLTQWYATAYLDMKVRDTESNVYFGVYPVGGKKSNTQRATIADIVALNCLFREYDLKDFDGTKDDLREYTIALDPFPSVIVETAGGFHVYWLFDEPIPVKQDKIEHYQHALYGWSAMDKYADINAKDLARVLRVPGTYNQKSKYAESERLTQICYWRPTHRLNGVNLLRDGLEYYQAQKNAQTHVKNAVKGIQTPRGEFNQERLTKYVNEILSDLRLVAQAPEGQRTETMMKVARRIGQVVSAGVLDFNDALNQVVNACMDNGLVKEDGRASIEKQITNALNWSKEHLEALDLRKFETYDLTQNGLTIHGAPVETPDPRESEAAPDRNPVDSEMAVLGLLLSNGAIHQELLNRYALSAGHFANPRHQRIYSAIGYVALSGTPDLIGVMDILKRRHHLQDVGGKEYLDALEKAQGKLESLDVYVKAILSASVSRQMTGFINAVSSINNNPSLEPDEKIIQAKSLLENVKTPSSNKKAKNMLDNALSGLDLIDRAIDDDYGWSTGYPALDTFGLLAPGELIGLYGRPGMGKSAFALNMIRRALKKGRKIGFLSLEMTGEKIAFRMSSSEMRIPFGNFPKLTDMQDYRNYLAFTHNFPLAQMYLEDQTYNHQEIINWLNMMVLENGVHEFYLDHTGMVAYPAAEKRADSMGDFALELRKFAKATDSYVIALGQLNRACEQRADKRPFASDIGESDKIGHHADRLWMLYRDAKYGVARPGHENDLEVLIRKNRDAGSEGTAILGWDGSFQNVYDVDIVKVDG